MEHTLDWLRGENSKLRYAKEMMDWQSESQMQFHNEKISKLHNLESVFIGDVDQERDEDPWWHSHSVIAQENEAMRQQIINLEYERMQMRQELMAV